MKEKKSIVLGNPDKDSHLRGLFMCGQTIHKSKSGKLAWSDKFLEGQPRRDQPKDFSRVVKAAFLMFGLFVALLVASGLHRHIIYGGW